MRKILLFVNGEPAKLLKVSGTNDKLLYLYPDGKTRLLPIKITFATFSNGKSGAISVASDRTVSLGKVLEAHKKLVLKV